MEKYRIEISGAGEKETLTLEGCKLIEKYTDCEIAILLFDRKLIITGKSLTIPVFFKENICICGYIKNVTIAPPQKSE